jgi:hypothetical protein
VIIPFYRYTEADVGYTISMWVMNEGSTLFTTREQFGRENQYHFFRLENVFSLWFDSPTSFRVYVYTLRDFESFSSPSVFLPLN